MNIAKLWLVGYVGVTASAGCVANGDEAENFREAVPQAEDVALRVPGASTTTARQGLDIAANALGATTARYYRFSRDMTSAVDGATAVILGGIWVIVNSPPTTVTANMAVWGPGQGNALDPAIYKFTVVEVGDAEYDYALEGQPKTGGDFVAVLRGHGYGKSRPEHHSGWFQWDNEAYRTLDPDRARDTGTAKVTYDLRQAPAVIRVELRPEKGSADIAVTHDVAGAGALDISALADVDDSKLTKLENIHVASRWLNSGAGRADAEISNGDLALPVTATECWSTTFARVFYQDSIDFEPPFGDAAACAITTP